MKKLIFSAALIFFVLPLLSSSKSQSKNSVFKIQPIPQDYFVQQIHPFSEDLALVSIASKKGAGKKNELMPGTELLYGYIKKSGKVVIPFLYTKASRFYQSQAIVQKDNQLFYINKKGEKTKPILEKQILANSKENNLTPSNSNKPFILSKSTALSTYLGTLTKTDEKVIHSCHDCSDSSLITLSNGWVYFEETLAGSVTLKIKIPRLNFQQGFLLVKTLFSEKMKMESLPSQNQFKTTVVSDSGTEEINLSMDENNYFSMDYSVY